jgi:hypothetical protein
MLLSSSTFGNLGINPLVPRHQEQVHTRPGAMSTCSSNCQNYSCANSEDFAQTKLTLILGVLDLFNGFLGVLVAILVGYLQARQFRRFNRAMDGSNDDEKASQQPLKPAATRPEPA